MIVAGFVKKQLGKVFNLSYINVWPGAGVNP